MAGQTDWFREGMKAALLEHVGSRERAAKEDFAANFLAGQPRAMPVNIAPPLVQPRQPESLNDPFYTTPFEKPVDRIQAQALMSSRVADLTGGQAPQIQQQPREVIAQQMRTELARIFPQMQGDLNQLDVNQLLALAAIGARQGNQPLIPEPNRATPYTLPGTQTPTGQRVSQNASYPGMPVQTPELRFLEQNLMPPGKHPGVTELAAMVALGQPLEDGTPVTNEMVQEAARISNLPETAPERVNLRQAQEAAFAAEVPVKIAELEQELAKLEHEGRLQQQGWANGTIPVPEDMDAFIEQNRQQAERLRQELDYYLTAQEELNKGTPLVNLRPSMEFTFGLQMLDWPRQQVVTMAGENALDVAEGREPRNKIIDWSPWGDQWNPTGFNEWYKNPQNHALIRNAYYNGYTAGNGMQFTGGRAVWELYAGSQMPGWAERVGTDLFYDPLNVPLALSGGGKTAQILGKAAKIGLAEAAIEGTLLNVGAEGLIKTGAGLRIPQHIMDFTADAVLPGLVKTVKGGLFPEGLPRRAGPAGVLGNIRREVGNLTAPSETARVDRELAEVEEAVGQTKRAWEQQPTDEPSAPEGPRFFEGFDEPIPGTNVPPRLPTAGAAPEPGTARALLDEAEPLEPVSKPPDKIVTQITKLVGIPKNMAWTVRDMGREYAETALFAMRTYPERMGEFNRLWKSIAEPHIQRFHPTAKIENMDDLFSHADLVYQFRKLFNDHFPEFQIPDYRMGTFNAQVAKATDIKNIVARLVFGTRQEVWAARRELARMGLDVQKGAKRADLVWRFSDAERTPIPRNELLKRAEDLRQRWIALMTGNEQRKPANAPKLTERLPEAQVVSEEIPPDALAGVPAVRWDEEGQQWVAWVPKVADTEQYGAVRKAVVTTDDQTYDLVTMDADGNVLETVTTGVDANEAAFWMYGDQWSGPRPRRAPTFGTQEWMSREYPGGSRAQIAPTDPNYVPPAEVVPDFENIVRNATDAELLDRYQRYVELEPSVPNVNLKPYLNRMIQEMRLRGLTPEQQAAKATQHRQVSQQTAQQFWGVKGYEPPPPPPPGAAPTPAPKPPKKPKGPGGGQMNLTEQVREGRVVTPTSKPFYIENTPRGVTAVSADGLERTPPFPSVAQAIDAAGKRGWTQQIRHPAGEAAPDVPTPAPQQAAPPPTSTPTQRIDTETGEILDEAAPEPRASEPAATVPVEQVAETPENLGAIDTMVRNLEPKGVVARNGHYWIPAKLSSDIQARSLRNLLIQTGHEFRGYREGTTFWKRGTPEPKPPEPPAAAAPVPAPPKGPPPAPPAAAAPEPGGGGRYTVRHEPVTDDWQVVDDSGKVIQGRFSSKESARYGAEELNRSYERGHRALQSTTERVEPAAAAAPAPKVETPAAAAPAYVDDKLENVMANLLRRAEAGEDDFKLMQRWKKALKDAESRTTNAAGYDYIQDMALRFTDEMTNIRNRLRIPAVKAAYNPILRELEQHPGLLTQEQALDWLRQVVEGDRAYGDAYFKLYDAGIVQQGASKQVRDKLQDAGLMSAARSYEWTIDDLPPAMREAPKVEATPAGPQNVMPSRPKLEWGQGPVRDFEGNVVERQVVSDEALDLELQGPSAEVQRANELAAGQQDMFGAAPPVTQAAPAPESGTWVLVDPKQGTRTSVTYRLSTQTGPDGRLLDEAFIPAGKQPRDLGIKVYEGEGASGQAEPAGLLDAEQTARVDAARAMLAENPEMQRFYRSAEGWARNRGFSELESYARSVLHNIGKRGEKYLSDDAYDLGIVETWLKRADERAAEQVPTPAAAVEDAVEEAAKVADAIERLDPEVVRMEAPAPSNITTTTVDKLVLDVDRYQMRKAPFVRSGVDQIKANWDPQQLTPLQVARRPDGTFEVLAGHNRRQAILEKTQEGTLAKDFPVPIQIGEGDAATLRKMALKSNDVIEMKPSEIGGKIRTLMDEYDETLDQARGAVKASDAQKYINLTYLSQSMQSVVDQYPSKFLDTFAVMGDYIRRGVSDAAEMDRAFEVAQAAPGGFTDKSVSKALEIMEQLRPAGAEQLGLFAGMDVGKSSFGRALEVVQEMLDMRTSLNGMRNRLLGIGKESDLNARYGIQLSPDQQEALQLIEQKIATIDRRMSSHAKDWFGGELRSDLRSLGDVPDGMTRDEFFNSGIASLFFDPHAAARKAAREARLAALEAKMAGEPVPMAGRPVIISDWAEQVMTRELTGGDLAGITYKERIEDLLGMPIQDATWEQLREVLVILSYDIKRDMGFVGKRVGLLERGNRAFSSFMLLPFWSIPRNIIGNTWLGNIVQQAVAGHFRAALHGTDPRNIAGFLKQARTGALAVDTPAYRALEQWGMIPDPRVYRGFGMEALGSGAGGVTVAKGTNAAEKLAQGASPRLRTRIKVKGPEAIRKWTGINFGRELQNGFEWSFRVGAGAEHLRYYVVKHWGGFIDDAVESGRRLAPKANEFDIRQTLLKRGWRTNPQQMYSDLYRLAKSSGADHRSARGFAERVSRDWSNLLNVGMQEARQRGVFKSLFSYESTRGDELLRKFVPFHMYLTRAYPFYAQEMVRHPGLANAYFKAHEELQEYAENNNWPAALRGFAKLTGGPMGLALFVQPIMAGAFLDLFVDINGGYTPDNVSGIGRALNMAQRAGFGLLPWWSGMLNYAGFMGNSAIGLDPVGTFGARKWFGTWIQWAAAEGLFGDDWQRYLGKPFEERLARVRAYTSGWLPGSYNIPQADQGAVGAEIIRNMMLTDALDERSIDQTEFNSYATYPEGTPQRELYDDLLEELWTQWDQQDGSYFDDALEAYSQFEAIEGNIARSFIVGPKSVRSLDQMERANAVNNYREETPDTPEGFSWWPNSDPYMDSRIAGNEQRFLEEWKKKYGKDYEPGDLDRLRAAEFEARDISRYTPEAAPMMIADSQRDVMGDPRDRKLLSMWNEIAFGDMSPETVSAGDNRIYQVNGQIYWREQLAGMTQDERFALADAWVAERDPDGSVQALRDQRDVFDQSHPEYALYEAWKKDTRKAWESYGQDWMRTYRAELSRQNPNAKRFFNEQVDRIRKELGPSATVNQINQELDKVTMSIEAYMAIKGIRPFQKSPQPLESGVDPRPPGSGATGSSGGAGSDSVPWDQRVPAAITDAESKIGEANALLSQVSGQQVDYFNLPPMVKDWADSQLAAAGFEWGDDFWIYEKWRDWALNELRMGRQPSLEAFLVATEKPEGGTTLPTPRELYEREAA